jgi:hypothetical protein
MIHPEGNCFAGMSPLPARGLLALLVVLMAYGVLIREHTDLRAGAVQDPADTDVAMYARIVERMHGGEGYYDAAGSELRSGGYPTRSVFNWRLPTLAWLLAWLPGTGTARLVIGGLACTALVLWTRQLENIRPHWLQAAGGALLFFPFVLTALPPFHMYHEAWCGVLMALSIVLYARGCKGTAMAAGLAALFIRELALPFVAVMMFCAWREKRRGEALTWLAGIAGFVLFLCVHAWLVSRHLGPEERAPEGWGQMGGWAFVLKTVRVNPLLQLKQTPLWIPPLLAPLGLLGLAAWKGPAGDRVAWAVGVYVVSFLFVGRTVNAYWGLVYAPLMPLGWLLAPQALMSVIRAAAGTGRPPNT